MTTRTPWDGHKDPAPGHIPAALQLDEAANYLSATTRAFAHLGAILEVVRDGLPEHSRLRALADAGCYLAADMGNDSDCWREAVEASLAAGSEAP